MSVVRFLGTRVPFSRAIRPFSSSALSQKSLTDSVKETAENLNKKVGQTLASGIDSTEKAAQSAKSTINTKTPSEGEAKSAADNLGSKAAETVESARQGANRTLGQAAGSARDAKDEVKKNI
ncbi:hypothetical protein I312_103973 [Cryptococcus bacillisporus CA1280]|uniref:Uncharacterized protein n=2 Tax=Cryptococcus gattii TaxID=552467 RepID=A0A0D0TDC9_CRYGA|nr:hypothetical protein I312_06471 [Cryptococcus bacillisporus CA1280]KIR64163.1 hypothetical protein I314_02948 [Cryptococcus bacillisporus CA1873]|eukprot:KIR64163.1 hypothetical protein I314_02948 [Cryptococcus gattii CA1873]